MDEKEFLERLRDKKLIESYRSRKRQLIRDIETEFRKNEKFLKERHRSAIDDDNRHRELMNSCIYPFTKNGSLADSGYRFVRASPLVELNVPNMDFLLFKPADRLSVAILGECKGSVSDPEHIIKQVEYRRTIVEKYSKHIRKEYLQLSDSDDLFFEYVIAVPSLCSGDILNKIIQRESKFIVWHTPLTGNAKISIEFPPPKLEIPRENMIHRDKKLKQALRRKQPAPIPRKVFDFFPQMHPFSELRPLISVATPGVLGLVITEDALRGLLKKDLYYMKDNFINKKIESVLSQGQEIGFLEWIPEEKVYKIKAKGTRRDTLEKNLKDKWINHRLKTDLEAKKREEIRELQEEYIAKTGMQRFLIDF